MDPDFEERLKEYIQTMPSLPTSVEKVLEICNNPHTSPADLNHVISLDPVLVGRVLKLLNSAYYGLAQPITNLVRAIIMLGINTVKNLALSSTVVGNLSTKKKIPGLDMEGFWRHSLCVGVSAKLLAKKRGIDSKLIEEYFTAGFLHDIGKIPLNAVLSKEYMLTIAVADRKREPLYVTEKHTLGLSHCETGAMIKEAWKLDGAIGDTIMNHHNCDEYKGNYKDVLYTVAAANRFSTDSYIGFSGNRRPSQLSDAVWNALDISGDIFDGIKENVHKEIEKAEVFLKIGQL